MSCKNLNTQCFTNLFFPFIVPSCHTHTHTFATPGTDCNALASLVVGEEGWELSSDIHLIFSDHYYIQYNTSMESVEEAVCVWGHVCGRVVTPMTTSISTPLPVQFWGLMVSHHTHSCLKSSKVLRNFRHSLSTPNGRCGVVVSHAGRIMRIQYETKIKNSFIHRGITFT